MIGTEPTQAKDTMNRRYLINTIGEKVLVLSIVELKIPPEVMLAFRPKECSWFAYQLFKHTRINLLAEDKFKWLKAYLKARLHV